MLATGSVLSTERRTEKAYRLPGSSFFSLPPLWEYRLQNTENQTAVGVGAAVQYLLGGDALVAPCFRGAITFSPIGTFFTLNVGLAFNVRGETPAE